MNSLLIIPLCLVGGWALRRMGMPQTWAKYLTNMVIYMALPALILAKIPAISFKTQFLLPMLMPWLLFILAIGLFWFLGKQHAWPKATVGGITLTAGLGNTSFIGIPVMQAIWGDAGVQVALLADQPGSFACLSALGIIVASAYSGSRLSVKVIGSQVIKFPPFLAFIFAFGLGIANWQFSGTVLQILNFLGSLVVPIALIAVGLQLSIAAFRNWPKPVQYGLVYKLVLAPLLIYVLYILLLKQNDLLAKGSVIEAAMGPMVTAALVADVYNLNSRLVYQLLSIGILLSFLSLPLWWLLVRWQL